MPKTALFDPNAAQGAQVLQQKAGEFAGALDLGVKTAQLGHAPTAAPSNSAGASASSSSDVNRK